MTEDLRMTGNEQAEAALDRALAAARAAAPAPAGTALLERIMADAATVAAAWAPEPPRKKPAPDGAFASALRRIFATPALRPACACVAAAAFGLWLGQSALIAAAAEALLAAPDPGLFEDDPIAGVALAFGYDEEGW